MFIRSNVRERRIFSRNSRYSGDWHVAPQAFSGAVSHSGWSFVRLRTRGVAEQQTHRVFPAGRQTQGAADPRRGPRAKNAQRITGAHSNSALYHLMPGPRVLTFPLSCSFQKGWSPLSLTLYTDGQSYADPLDPAACGHGG